MATKPKVTPKPALPPSSSRPAAGRQSPAPAIAGSRGKYQFVIEAGVTLPTTLPTRTPGNNDLPFKEWFGQIIDKEPVFIPTAFWTGATEDGGRGADPAKVDVAYAKTKIRTAFYNWVKKDEATRGNLKMILVARDVGDQKGDTGQTYKEPGMSVWIQTADAPSG